MDGSDIRKRFADFYKHCGFRLISQRPVQQSSSTMSFIISCAPPDLMSLPSDVSQTDRDFVRVQTCFRHFDLASVGRDNRHLSSFDMAGAFHLGKTDPENAVSRVWNLTTQVLGMDSDRIWVTYFGGGNLNGLELPEDAAVRQAWKQVGIPETRLVPLGISDNFWVEGAANRQGDLQEKKCGSNTELFYDRGADHACGASCKPGCVCGRFIEFSNTRFISHLYRLNAETLIPLDLSVTETVMGIERTAMILSDAESVFDVAPYPDLIRFIRSQTFPSGGCDGAFPFIRQYEKILADHLKSLCILVSEGAPPPGRSGRARIVRVLIRRMLTCMMLLGTDIRAMLSLIPFAVQSGSAQLSSDAEHKMTTYIGSEYPTFIKTVHKGQTECRRMLAENGYPSLSMFQTAILKEKWGLPELMVEGMIEKDKF